MFVSPTASYAEETGLFRLTDRGSPVGINAREPSLAPLPDGRVLLSWTEEKGAEAEVRMAILDRNEWSDARTIHKSSKTYINWADFPSVVALAGGGLAAQWLELNGPGDYQYDVNIAFSKDEGRSWTDPLVPHDDRSQREHGFVSLVPDQFGGLTALWLDGREYDSQTEGESFENAMQLRARQINSDGTMSAESLLDVRTCTCCQTSAARTGSGDIVAVYRDRTADEIRDISVLRQTNGEWTQPAPIHNDGWEIAGCPVNGPAIDTMDDKVSVIWFTAAENEPKVHIAFSDDGGAQFDEPLRIDLGAAAGRVDILQLADGSALALWIEYVGGGEAIVMCHVTPDVGCVTLQALHINRGGGSVGFPRMVRGATGAFVAWTQPTSGADGNTTIRVVEVAVTS
ncbi:sialidase family protein [uncultured Sulfitobacter sp.]|uniref:sialidase family protein n=1 Tax=uncultured Sulfitobacter sp. TaxID=191468 RepID=UPI00261E73A7|nr:sialidase family protein [uncultured Sulfitobacter sp.]